ncbi:multiple antibiotic resistance protein MarB [Superficieibacter electus]|uniref:Multiple antibiotic resistance protein MarB n=1 Tax=Superficieibacter electus TaxID=2022662 RepID=A0A2P5GTT5_9ENTR|nr:multiple antibiotic resistance protein MarB [Superficieibacter electus]POP47116.1 multiple antibiotic resistance protein MarB [Superficieibacter electus]POP49962.1 multiple antibiotic resistance protein MarB [Superficieibacter electus]
MKLLVSATLALALLTSGQSFAEQSRQAVEGSARATLIMPSTHDQSPFDFNHMGTGSDKSDALGVPYYNEHSL